MAVSDGENNGEPSGERTTGVRRRPTSGSLASQARSERESGGVGEKGPRDGVDRVAARGEKGETLQDFSHSPSLVCIQFSLFVSL